MRFTFYKLIFVALLALVLQGCVHGWRSAPDSPSLEKKIGQMVMIGFEGARPKDRSVQKLSADIRFGRIGGVLLLERNIQNRYQLKLLTKKLQSAVPDQLPLLIAVDQEGGEVQRLNSKNGFSDFPSAKDVAHKLKPESVGPLYEEMADILYANGINLNFAPVVDVEVNPNSPAIGKRGRSFSPDPFVVAAYAEQFVKAHHKHHILTSLKHFPGHGSAKLDSHLDLPNVSLTWKEDELVPYIKLIQSGEVDSIMSAHVFNRKIDPVYPASISGKTIQGLLRDEMDYRGVVITDDLQMGAIDKMMDLDEVVIRAVNSGSDILLFANYFKDDPELPEKVRKIIKRSVHRGDILESRINESYERIRKLKAKLRE